MSTTNESTENHSTSDGNPSNEGITITAGEEGYSDITPVDEGLSGIDAAMARANARVDSENKQVLGAPDNNDGSTENTNSGKPDGTEAAGGDDESSPDSTVEIPSDWPQDRRDAVAALPVDAQQIVLSVSQDMEAGLTNAYQTITDIKEQHQGIVDTMQEHGFNGERVSEVLSTAAAFDADPKGTLEALAQAAGIDLFFSGEEANGQPPAEVLEDPAKYSKWVVEQAQKNITRQQTHDDKVKAERDRKQTSEARLKDEFTQAEEKIPNFAEHKPAVIAKLQDLAEGASVHDAYKLASYDSLFKMAEDGHKAITEVADLKNQIETLKKNGTQLVTGAPLDEAEDEKLKNMDPASRAAHKARKRMSASQ